MKRVIQNKTLIMIVLCISCLIHYLTNSIEISLLVASIAILPALLELRRRPIFCIKIVLFFAFSAMGLLPTVEMFGGTLNWADFNIIMFIILTIFCITHHIKKIVIDKIGIIIIVFLTFRIVGAITGYLIYKQNIMVGLLVKRETYIYLTYFPISAIIKK